MPTCQSGRGGRVPNTGRLDILGAMALTTFGIVGSGWRSEFFLRLAAAAPEQLRAAGVVTRTAGSGAGIEARWGVPTFRSAPELLERAPDYVIVSTPWAATPHVTRELVALGARVLAETPPAPDLK